MTLGGAQWTGVVTLVALTTEGLVGPASTELQGVAQRLLRSLQITGRIMEQREVVEGIEK